MSLFSRLSPINPAQGSATNNARESNVSCDALSPENRTDESSSIGNKSKVKGSEIGNNPIRDNPNKKTLREVDVRAGVLIKTLKPGDATNWPKKGDTCAIHYEAFLEQEMYQDEPEPFDSSRRRKQVFHFRLGMGQVIEGLDVVISKMSAGEKVEATIPYAYGYGIAGYPPLIPPRSTLIFRVELLRFSSLPS